MPLNLHYSEDVQSMPLKLFMKSVSSSFLLTCLFLSWWFDVTS